VIAVRRLLRAGFALFALWLAFAGAQAARADCAQADVDLARAQALLKSAEPSRDSSVADFARRLQAIADADRLTDDANTVLTTTPGGCHDIQQVYNQLQTAAWVHLLVAYLKPSLEFYLSDDDCRALSRIATQSAVANADATMNRSLIYWNPIDPQEIATRVHVTELVATTAQRSSMDLPADQFAGEFAHVKQYALDVARSRVTTDCASTLPKTVVPADIATIAFGGPEGTGTP
jgi:hypothetical protein